MDVRLFHKPDGGEIESVNGQLVMDAGLETASYLSLFGGNERDSGLKDDEAQEWWGNLSETDPKRRYRSEFQHLIRSLPLTTGNVKRLQDAAERDLAWFTAEVADSVSVDVTVPALNKAKVSIKFVIGGKPVGGGVFVENWRARAP